MKRILIYLSIAISSFCANAESALPATQAREVIGKINEVTSKLKSMKCNFTQTKYISLLNDKMVSSGQMYYNQPNKLRWEYTSPYNYLFVFNGTKVYVGNKTKKDVINTDSNKIFKEIARIMMNTVTGKALSNSTDFSSIVVSTQKDWNVTLVPKKKELKQMFAKIELVFHKSNLMISEINIIEKNNDKTNIKLNNVRVNETIRESLFNIP